MEKVPPPTNADQRRLLIVDKPDRTQTRIDLGQIGVKMTDLTFFRCISEISPRRRKLSVSSDGRDPSQARMELWCGQRFSIGLQPRSWHVHLFPAAKDTPAALEYTLKMIEQLRAQGIKADKFDFAQRSLVNSAGFMYNTPKKRVENKLLEKTLDLPDGFMKTYGPELSKMKPIK